MVRRTHQQRWARLSVNDDGAVPALRLAPQASKCESEGLATTALGGTRSVPDQGAPRISLSAD
jgi:hypothetical protein